MIGVPRLPKPTILHRKERVWLEDLLEARTKEETKRASQKYRHKAIRDALERMFHGKCAYCESRITHVSYANIEHYRPQATFALLTFDWDNLLLACTVCNSSRYKGDRFPGDDQGGPPINPCADSPEDHFEFRYDPTAKLATVCGRTKRGLMTEGLVGLNRQELRRYRSQQVTRLAALARFAQVDPNAQQLLKEARQAESEYAAFARALPYDSST
jgi:uncharacterized protein (TIGR02646 family)